jgi:hypothetical protein
MISTKRVLQTFVHSAPDSSSAAPIYASGDIDGGDGEAGNESSLSVECVGFCANAAFKWVATGGMDKVYLCGTSK